MWRWAVCAPAKRDSFGVSCSGRPKVARRRSASPLRSANPLKKQVRTVTLLSLRLGWGGHRGPCAWIGDETSPSLPALHVCLSEVILHQGPKLLELEQGARPTASERRSGEGMGG